MNYESLLKELTSDIKTIYRDNSDAPAFHDKIRKKELLKLVREFALIYKFSDEDTFIIECSALIYGTGYLDTSSNPGAVSIANMERQLKNKGLDQQVLNSIRNNISAAMGNIIADVLMSQLFCDCVYSFFGSDDFDNDVKLLWKEEKRKAPNMSKEEFYRSILKQMELFKYVSSTAQERFNAQKDKNLLYLTKKIPPIQSIPIKESHVHNSEHSEQKVSEPKIIRGVDTMFKISSTNHQRLSDLADNKAHILITVNSIILSAILSLLLRRLSDNHFLIIPTALILCVSLGAMIFAILATRPSVPGGLSTREQIDRNEVNLLFFGNFYRMPIDDFKYGMEKIMVNSDLLYQSLMTDIYMQGVVLGKKYKLLRFSYNIFMYGLIVSVLSFAIAAALFLNV